MSVHHTQSRSKSDFDQLKVHPSATLHLSTRSHPPRLQHSPSLPNIRFPPHSGPLPTGISAGKRVTQGHLHRPPTPPAPAPHSSPKTPQMTSPDIHNDIVSGLKRFSLNDEEIHHNSKATPLDTRKRRKDRSTVHHLLTPPLTPSSSIKTTASSAESTDTKHAENSQVLRELQEPTATRYLFLSNISRDIESISLQMAVTDALSSLPPRRNSKSLNATDDKSNSSCIKGFFIRHLETTGTLFLAFHDIRDALTASDILPHGCHGVSTEYGDEQDKLSDGSERLHCRFVTAEELVKTIGNSTFLATNDGDFLLSATPLDDPNDPSLQSHCINAHTLIKYLETYGDLRLFMPEKESTGNETFSVEFFDVRDANEAYAALDGQVMFGMKLRTLGRVTGESSQVGEVKPDAILLNQDPGRSDSTPQWNHQPSTSESHIPKLRTAIGPAGEVSQMRGRFTCHSKRSRPRAVSAGNEAAVSPPRHSDRQPNASPTIFYTSFDLNGSYVNPQFPTHVRNPNEHRTNIPENNGEAIEYSDDNVKTRGELQQSCSIAECRYCPSKYHDTSSTQRPYNPPLNSSFINPINPMPFAMQRPPSVFIGPNEFEGQSQGVFPTPSWLFDPNHLLPPAINVDMFNAYGHAAVPVVPIEHRFPEQNRFMSNPLVYPSMSSTPIPIQTQPPSIDMAAELDHDIFVDNPTESSATLDSDPNLKVSTTAAGQNDRNILNIQRIEDGLDTRTTVMIKNIPNKMTAKDLIQYISEVCPRKFDFLYLRMDFKNGCNVGYAFVNFIRVQDMMYFAKERLGIKWNMFSSEKVLQMSYANYQGKEALVEKFKNSCIMDEREEWRPKIFYSSGPEQGLPEPFPAPTHLRRKERSLHNRGALYVPGASGSSVNLTGPLRRQEYSSGSSKYLEHRRHGHVDRSGVDSFGGGRRNKFNYQPSA